MPAHDLSAVRQDFPILAEMHHDGVPLIYLDSAATSQKPRAVIEAMTAFYTHSNANVHRGLHKLSEEATTLYENARRAVQRFIGAANWREVIFTRGTTEGINLAAQTWGRANLGPGDVVLSTVMEHHANLVSWQILAAERGFTLRYVPVLPDGTLDLDTYARMLREERVKLVAVTHASNVLGTINPIIEMARLAHEAGALILADGAQAVPHLPVDVQVLGVDFYAFSGHKMCGPTGIGVLYARRDLLNGMPPFMGGGDMIETVTLDGSTWASPPHKFEAGTPPIAEAVGLGAAVAYLSDIGMDAIREHERTLTAYTLDRLAELPGVTVYGGAPERVGALAFSVEGLHAHDVAQLLDAGGIAVRAGHHCAMPLHTALGLPATARASLYLYNTETEIDALAVALGRLVTEYA